MAAPSGALSGCALVRDYKHRTLPKLSFCFPTRLGQRRLPASLIARAASNASRVGAAPATPLASRDEARVVEHLVSVGRRTAIGRTAHFFMELAERLVLIDLATPNAFRFPLTQNVIADALGLTSIHVNQVLRQLREQELLTVERDAVRVHNLPGLKKFRDFAVAT